MSMSDRELLELAAKACGIRHVDYSGIEYEGAGGLMLVDENGRHLFPWNPLGPEGNATAFLLMTGLKLSVNSNSLNIGVGGYTFDGGYVFAQEEVNGNATASMRRAIVRAAAEIGKSMQESK